MPEIAVKKKLNNAKKSVCRIFRKAGYKIQPASNELFCVIGMRHREWRCVKVGIKPIVSEAWFLREIKRLENMPCPDAKTIKREIWIREEDGQNFNQFYWEDNQWFNENDEPVKNFNT